MEARDPHFSLSLGRDGTYSPGTAWNDEEVHNGEEIAVKKLYNLMKHAHQNTVNWLLQRNTNKYSLGVITAEIMTGEVGVKKLNNMQNELSAQEFLNLSRSSIVPLAGYCYETQDVQCRD